MPNFVQEIEEVMVEPIISVVISEEEYSYRFDEDSGRHINEGHLNRFLPWLLGRLLLDYEYDDGYGGVDCHAVTVWSENWVGFVGCYDGASWVTKVPRHPVDHRAKTVGGG